MDLLAKESEKVGQHAAAYADSGEDESSTIEVVAGENIGYVLPHKVSGSKKTKFFFRAQKPFQDVVLRAGSFEKKFKFLQPNEMSSVFIPTEHMKKGEKLEIWIEEK